MSNLAKKTIITLIGLSFLGLLDAVYLTVNHYQNSSVACFIVNNCDRVLQSSYAMLGAVPVSLLGVLYYLTVLILSVLAFAKKNERILFFSSSLTFAGLLASVWFLSVQIFILNAFCSFCLFSALVSIALFALGLAFLVRYNKTNAQLDNIR